MYKEACVFSAVRRRGWERTIYEYFLRTHLFANLWVGDPADRSPRCNEVLALITACGYRRGSARDRWSCPLKCLLMARRPRTRAAEGLLAGPSRRRRCTHPGVVRGARAAAGL